MTESLFFPRNIKPICEICISTPIHIDQIIFKYWLKGETSKRIFVFLFYSIFLIYFYSQPNHKAEIRKAKRTLSKVCSICGFISESNS